MNKVDLYVNIKQKKMDGTCAIYVSTTICRTPVRFNTGVSAKPENIDFSKGSIRGNSKDVKDKNLIVSNCRARVNDILVRYRLRFAELTPELLRREYDRYTSNFQFYDYAMLKLNERKLDISPGTYRRHAYQLKKVERFSPKAHITDITEDFMQRLIRWCKRECDNIPSAVINTIKVVKFYYHRAEREKLVEGDPFRDLGITCNVSNREYLNKSELQRLVKLYRSGALSDSHQNVLRYFLFSCFTGLRFGDVKIFSRQHIVGNTIVLQMTKTKNETGKVVKIPIVNAVWDLIGNISQKGEKEPIFRVISNEKTNDFLEEVILKSGIEKHITYHCSRHTFATNFLAENGEKLATLQELLGHSRVDQTRIYAHVLYENIEQDMQFLNSVW